MKRKILYFLLTFTLITGCELLDYSEQSFYDDPEDIFSNFKRTSQFLADIYNRLPTDYCSVGCGNECPCAEALRVLVTAVVCDQNCLRPGRGFTGRHHRDEGERNGTGDAKKRGRP